MHSPALSVGALISLPRNTTGIGSLAFRICIGGLLGFVGVLGVLGTSRLYLPPNDGSMLILGCSRNSSADRGLVGEVGEGLWLSEGLSLPVGEAPEEECEFDKAIISNAAVSD